MTKSSVSFCEAMRASAQKTWDRIVDHRFFRDIEADTVEDRVFAKYLAIEYGFVDRAAVALGYAVAKAPSFHERRHMAIGLYGLVTDQEQFFVAAFEKIAAPAHLRCALTPNALTAPLHDHFRSVAMNEGYDEILAATLGAEWMYLTWCSRANASPSKRAYIRDWVALHAGGPFAYQVAWLRTEIDARAPNLGPERQARLHQLFEETLAAEIPFHDAAYEGHV